jgi:hypothetical protein
MNALKKMKRIPIIASQLFAVTLFLTTLCSAQISPISNGSWQDQNIWPETQLPTPSDEVLIPVGFVIELAGNIKVKNITINGRLTAISSIQLETEWIMVMGNGALFEVGTNTIPFDGENQCTITLIGQEDNEPIKTMGNKFIGAMNGGKIEFHGQEKVSWSNLGRNVKSGANQIIMAQPVDWEIGEEIVIVSSRLNWEEAEQRTIHAMSNDGLTITLDTPLNYPHLGVLKTYTRSTDNKTWTADLRAEVGLLTHNVKIQGDPNSVTDGYGGHIMAMSNSTINASSIELYHMGQKGKLGRYPWHWHHVHLFGAGQYFKNSSVHHSFNRAITIHGTSHVNVENNFFYDHIGHGVFLEDGSERFNTIKNNVTLLTKRPLPGEELTPSDNELDQPQNRTPSSYWITNPNNIFEGNVAAGTQGTGFWFAFPKAPLGSSAENSNYSGIEPYKEPLGLFKNNKAHSCMSGFDIFDQLNSDNSIFPNIGWKNSSQHFIDKCTWYANDLALYTGIGGSVGDNFMYTNNLIFLDNILVDNSTAMLFASYSQVKESVFVASDLLPNSSLYRPYDGAGQLRDCHLVGWNENAASYLKNGGAAIKHTNHRISGITTADNKLTLVKLEDYAIPITNNDDTPQNPSLARVWNMVLYDEDGSFSGTPNSSIVSNHPMLLIGDEVQPKGWVNAYRSPHKFALSLLRFPGLSEQEIPNLTCTRTKNGTPTESTYDAYGFKSHIQFPFIVNEGFMYSYQFESLPTYKAIKISMDDTETKDNYLIRFKDFGKLAGLTLALPNGMLKKYNQMSKLMNSKQTSFLIEHNGDLYIKFVATHRQQHLNMSWNTDFTIPVLDTDRDGVSDRQEIITGTDPFEKRVSIELESIILLKNPVKKGEQINISLPLEFQNTLTKISIYSISGKNLPNFQLTSTNKISFSSSRLSRGIYVIQLESGGSKSNLKLVVE